MKTPEEIKNEYEQNHYRKQREQIDAGKLDYWGLTESNREAILAQCKAEAEKYPELRWEGRTYDGSVGRDIAWSFDGSCYYRRLDPLPVKAFTEEIEKYKEGLTRCVNDKLRLEKDFSRQKNLAKVATERVEELVRDEKALKEAHRDLLDQLQKKREELKYLHERATRERIALLQDIRTLAMRQS